MKTALVLAPVALAISAATPAQRPGADDGPRYGTQSGEARKGEVRAKKFPGNLYGVEVISRSREMSPAATERAAQQVTLRAAQLALENDRPVFAMFAPAVTRTAARTRQVRGIAPSTTWDAIPLPGGGTAYNERTIPGTPGYSYQLPTYEGAWTMVKLFTRDEAARRGATPADGMTDYDAELVYADLVDTTPGRWPTLIAIYEDLVERSEDELARSGAVTPRLTVINTRLKLSRLYREAGESEKGVEHLLRAGALVREGRQRGAAWNGAPAWRVASVRSVGEVRPWR